MVNNWVGIGGTFIVSMGAWLLAVRLGLAQPNLRKNLLFAACFEALLLAFGLLVVPNYSPTFVLYILAFIFGGVISLSYARQQQES